MNKLKQSRMASYLLITLVYVLATCLGVFVYVSLPLAFWARLLLADVAATLFVFLFSLLLGNASVYDPYWSVAPVVILTLLAMQSAVTPLRLILLVAVGLWGVRLTANWAYTFGDLTHEDWRYRMLKEKTGAFYPIINLVGIHMVPTLVVYLCALPAAYAFYLDLPLSPLSLVFIAISLFAVLLQGTADSQMHRFRQNRTGPFIRDGLWKYSRHPNYLGEILMWWGVGLAVTASAPSFWYFPLGALANTCLFLFVSIPLAEGKQSKKEGYEAYKKQTRMLLPIKK